MLKFSATAQLAAEPVLNFSASAQLGTDPVLKI